MVQVAELADARPFTGSVWRLDANSSYLPDSRGRARHLYRGPAAQDIGSNPIAGSMYASFDQRKVVGTKISRTTFAVGERTRHLRGDLRAVRFPGTGYSPGRPLFSALREEHDRGSPAVIDGN